MSLVHLHLLLNHVPVIGLAGTILLLVWAIMRKSDEVQRVALAALVLVALMSIPVFLTGEPAEEAVEDLAGVHRDGIHDHEEAAEAAFVAVLVAGATALGALALARRRALIARLALGVAMIAFVLIARTAWMGGQIRHTELHPGTHAGAEYEHD